MTPRGPQGGKLGVSLPVWGPRAEGNASPLWMDGQGRQKAVLPFWASTMSWASW